MHHILQHITDIPQLINQLTHDSSTFHLYICRRIGRARTWLEGRNAARFRSILFRHEQVKQCSCSSFHINQSSSTPPSQTSVRLCRRLKLKIIVFQILFCTYTYLRSNCIMQTLGIYLVIGSVATLWCNEIIYIYSLERIKPNKVVCPTVLKKFKTNTMMRRWVFFFSFIFCVFSNLF